MTHSEFQASLETKKTKQQQQNKQTNKKKPGKSQMNMIPSQQKINPKQAERRI
jgi:hypothetical protein